MAGLKKYTVAVDLDGVLAHYDKWPGDPCLIGDPIPGAVGFVEALLVRGFKVRVFTTRTNPEVNFSEDSGQSQLGNGYDSRWHKHLVKAVRTWLTQNGFPTIMEAFDVYHDCGKPIAIAYVDDRAVLCKPQEFGSVEDGGVEDGIIDSFNLAMENIVLIHQDILDKLPQDGPGEDSEPISPSEKPLDPALLDCFVEATDIFAGKVLGNPDGYMIISKADFEKIKKAVFDGQGTDRPNAKDVRECELPAIEGRGLGNMAPPLPADEP